VATHARLASRQRLGLLCEQGHSKEDSKEACGAESDQKTLLPSESHTICPGRRPIVVEFHSIPYVKQFGCQRILDAKWLARISH
jgi:hypothetical protein